VNRQTVLIGKAFLESEEDFFHFIARDHYTKNWLFLRALAGDRKGAGDLFYSWIKCASIDPQFAIAMVGDPELGILLQGLPTAFKPHFRHDPLICGEGHKSELVQERCSMRNGILLSNLAKTLDESRDIRAIG